MSEAKTQASSRVIENAPQLSTTGLTRLLIAMCMVPVITIGTLYWYMPPVFEGELEASVAAEDLPPASFYDTHFSKRDKVGVGVLLLTNDSERDWTHLNIQINKHYQVYDHETIPAGETRRYRTDRFVSKTGAKFSLRYNPLRSVRVYARRPSGDRATFMTEFDWESVQ